METHKATWSLTPLHDFSFHGDNKIGLWFERVWWYCNTICAWCFWHIFLHAIIPLPTTCGLWNNTTWCVILYNQNSDESQENRWDSWFSSPSQAFCFDFHMSIVTKFKDLFSNGFLAEQILQSNRQSSFPFGTSNQNGHIKISKDELFCGVRNKIKKQKSFSLIFSRNAKERFACGGNKTISTHRMVPVAIWLEERMTGWKEMPTPQTNAAWSWKLEGTGKIVPYTPELVTHPSISWAGVENVGHEFISYQRWILLQSNQTET